MQKQLEPGHGGITATESLDTLEKNDQMIDQSDVSKEINRLVRKRRTSHGKSRPNVRSSSSTSQNVKVMSKRDSTQKDGTNSKGNSTGGHTMNMDLIP